ncbi:MAG: quinone-dependent dihydroorotate dehydrogenase [Halobacteriales archaeon]|nr:quinone-dependent dihydroorotate dehydrogenase [Halobacteriales archaeon]
MYRAARPLLFALDAERAHGLAMAWLQRVSTSAALRTRLERANAVRDARLEQELWGLKFPGPVGLAAGLDKDARAPLAWQALGFGFAELGTATPEPQAGNAKPRLWRMPAEQALCNKMGFNNDGAGAIAERVARAKHDARIPLGANIGKNKDTPLDRAVDDYEACYGALAPHADFLVVNVSSPNTPGLRALQKREALGELLGALQDAAVAHGLQHRPLLVKLDPDLDDAALAETVGACLEQRVQGLVCTNTSVGLPKPAGAEGGVSGAPLRARSTQVLRKVADLTDGKLPLVGVGGVFTAEDAYAKVRAGASLVEVYTGFIYGGPGTARRIHEGLLPLLERDGFRHVRDAVGADRR